MLRRNWQMWMGGAWLMDGGGLQDGEGVSMVLGEKQTGVLGGVPSWWETSWGRWRKCTWGDSPILARWNPQR